MRPQTSWDRSSGDQSTTMRHTGKEEEKQSSRIGIERRAEDGISTVGGGRANFRRTRRRRGNWTEHRQYRAGRSSRCLHSGNDDEEEKGENKGKTRHKK